MTASKNKKTTENKMSRPKLPHLPIEPIKPNPPSEFIFSHKKIEPIELLSSDRMVLNFKDLMDARKEIKAEDDCINLRIANISDYTFNLVEPGTDNIEAYFEVFDKVPNPNYAQELKVHQEKLKEYENKIINFKNDIKKYRKDYSQYKKDMKKYNLFMLEQNKVYLEKKIEKLTTKSK